MGREIRRVPIGWEHPRGGNSSYRPLYDRDYDAEAAEWLEGCRQWEEWRHPDQLEGRGKASKYYWEYYGPPPDEEYYRCAANGTEFRGPPDGCQVYETVTEGTPVSPVFASPEEMVEWLVAPGGRDQGYPREAAEAFAKGGWAPSMVVVNRPGSPSQILSGIESLVGE